ncbi:hypothetical protein [Streptomyces sp. MAR4 CNX-425]|uniref:hypothetical protein n=1 Tax=Streptomyces sp. MAR4 CNX-425 TaxID=3406343 RepID=UPI003B50AE2E
MNTVNAVKPVTGGGRPAETAQPAPSAPPAMSGPPATSATSVPRQLARGALGFGLLAGSLALLPVAGPAALLGVPAALVVFRGCPACWLAGLAQSLSRGRLERRCTDGACTVAGSARPRPPG